MASCKTVVLGIFISPHAVGTEGQSGACEHLISSDVGSASPARIVGQRDIEGLAKRQCISNAGGAATDGYHCGITSRAVCLDSKGVWGVCIEAHDSVGGVGDAGSHEGVTAISSYYIYRIRGVGVSLIGQPAEGDAVARSSVNGHRDNFQTGGQLLEGHVVDIQCSVALLCPNGHIGIGGVGIGQRYCIFGIGSTADNNAVDKNKGVEISGVGHGADVDHLVVGGARRAAPEGDAVGIHGIKSHVERRQDGYLNLRIGSGGTSGELQIAATGVDIGRRVVAHRVVVIRAAGGIVDACPAPRELLHAGGSTHQITIFEAHDVGQ